MTTQQVPYTPRWRRFFSLPHTRLGWWAIGVSGIAMVSTFFIGTADFQLEVFGMSVAWGGAMLAAAIGVTQIIGVLSGPVVALIAVARDRSLLVWVAMVPGVLVLSGIVQIFMSMKIGPGELPTWYGIPYYGLPIGVLLWAVLVTNSFIWNRWLGGQ